MHTFSKFWAPTNWHLQLKRDILISQHPSPPPWFPRQRRIFKIFWKHQVQNLKEKKLQLMNWYFQNWQHNNTYWNWHASTRLGELNLLNEIDFNWSIWDSIPFFFKAMHIDYSIIIKYQLCFSLRWKSYDKKYINVPWKSNIIGKLKVISISGIRFTTNNVLSIFVLWIWEEIAILQKNK